MAHCESQIDLAKSEMDRLCLPGFSARWRVLRFVSFRQACVTRTDASW
jgi:hypothetical protein